MEGEIVGLLGLCLSVAPLNGSQGFKVSCSTVFWVCGELPFPFRSRFSASSAISRTERCFPGLTCFLHSKAAQTVALDLSESRLPQTMHAYPMRYKYGVDVTILSTTCYGDPRT